MCALCIDQFFQKGGVAEALNERELFNAVSGLNITADNEVDFQAEVQLSLSNSFNLVSYSSYYNTLTFHILFV